jgi:hypothetical protein
VLRNESLRVFIGYDSKEAVAFHVLCSSIVRRASIPVSIIPLTRQSVGRTYTRERGPTEATEFSLTRFLVPYLSDYCGLSVFMDCDMLMRVDILELWLELLAQPGKALWCCQHDYVPKSLIKFDGHEQTKYPRKNWSSFMVFDNAQCQALTPEYVNTATGLQLHRFQWLDENAELGALPLQWNWLIGEYSENYKAKNFHYTNGGPWLPEYVECDHSEDWWEEYGLVTAPAARTDQMEGALSA